jgi:alkanesulfonate monooxygenase SsuD/methylene tetrahydromethanopterin reductase-like flavin-dependent oxidoreductase (luciferase family)
MGKIQFGLVLPSGSRDKALSGAYMDNVRRLTELGTGHYDSAWFVDHLQFDDADLMEGWTAVTYLAALNPQFSWGHAVLCQSFRNPALLGKMAATLQYMSGGRFILGLGAGWKEDEYRSYGYDYPPAGTRVEQLEETLQIVKALWTEERATFHGKHYRVDEAWCEPKPNPLPTVMVGGAKPKMLRLIARHADWWNVSWTSIEDFRPQVEECERACAEVGRDPSTLRRTWFGGCTVGHTEEEVEELTGGRMKAGTAFVGTPEQVIEQMRPFVELGVDYFMLHCGGFPRLTTAELLINEVMPALNAGR